MKFLPKIDRKLRKLRKVTFEPNTIYKHTNTTSALCKTAASLFKQDALNSSDYKDYITQIELHFNYDKFPKILSKSTKENFMYKGSFHEAVGRVFLFAQFFSLMPVKGVTDTYAKQLSFGWTYLRTIYSILWIIIFLLDAALTTYKVLLNKITFNTIEPLIFHYSIIIVCISGLILARQWPALMLYWHKIESHLPQYDTQSDKRRLAHRIHMVAFIGMMLSLAEHIVNIISIIHYANNCPIIKDPIKNFLLVTNDQIFTIFAFKLWLAWLGRISTFFQTFIWNYMDIFVMIVSIGLAAKFKQLNDNLMKFKGLQMPEAFWAERRIQYRNLCMLCEKIDNAISVVTMVSFSNNLYFICVQLLKSINTKMPSTAHALYFYFSLFFLIGRTLAVSLYSASIHDESRKPLRILRCIPNESWCVEARRFAEDISSDFVGLSGMKFFHLTRKLVLSVAGTIVTYELVLIQFHQDTTVWDCSDNRPFVGVKPKVN